MADYSKCEVTDLYQIVHEYEKRFNTLWDFIRETDRQHFLSEYPEAESWFDLLGELTPPL